MLTPIDRLIEYASKYFTLEKGDMLFTGTPEGVGEVKVGDVFEAFVNGERLLKCEVKKPSVRSRSRSRSTGNRKKATAKGKGKKAKVSKSKKVQKKSGSKK
jgi:hypothetical protein